LKEIVRVLEENDINLGRHFQWLNWFLVDLPIVGTMGYKYGRQLGWLFQKKLFRKDVYSKSH